MHTRVCKQKKKITWKDEQSRDIIGVYFAYLLELRGELHESYYLILCGGCIARGRTVDRRRGGICIRVQSLNCGVQISAKQHQSHFGRPETRTITVANDHFQSEEQLEFLKMATVT